MNSSSENQSSKIDRRQFISTTALAGTAVLIGASAFQNASAAVVSQGVKRKRYALVGVGGRSGMYRDAILKTYAEHCEMVGYCDLNLGRLKLAQAKARRDRARGSMVRFLDQLDLP